MNDKDIVQEVEGTKKEILQDKPKPYPLREVLQGVPPVSHGNTIVYSECDKDVVGKNAGVHSKTSGIILQNIGNKENDE